MSKRSRKFTENTRDTIYEVRVHQSTFMGFDKWGRSNFLWSEYGRISGLTKEKARECKEQLCADLKDQIQRQRIAVSIMERKGMANG